MPSEIRCRITSATCRHRGWSGANSIMAVTLGTAHHVRRDAACLVCHSMVPLRCENTNPCGRATGPGVWTTPREHRHGTRYRARRHQSGPAHHRRHPVLPLRQTDHRQGRASRGLLSIRRKARRLATRHLPLPAQALVPQKVRHRNVEGGRDPQQPRDPGVGGAGLDVLQGQPLHSGQLDESLLGEVRVLASYADPVAETSSLVGDPWRVGFSGYAWHSRHGCRGKILSQPMAACFSGSWMRVGAQVAC